MSFSNFGILQIYLIWWIYSINKLFLWNLYRDSNGNSPKKFLMCVGFVIPCIVIIVCYSAIFAKVRQSRRNVQTHTSRYVIFLKLILMLYFHNCNTWNKFNITTHFNTVTNPPNSTMKTLLAPKWKTPDLNHPLLPQNKVRHRGTRISQIVQMLYKDEKIFD